MRSYQSKVLWIYQRGKFRSTDKVLGVLYTKDRALVQYVSTKSLSTEPVITL